MKSQDINQMNLPDSSGVYQFLDVEGNILYIGKATSIRDRVGSYFNSDILASRGPMIHQMVTLAKSVDAIKTDSVLEAIVLEAHLIKKHKPKYNTKEKDDKSFNYVVITQEDFPKVLIVRGKDLFSDTFNQKDIKYSFGPFPRGTVLKQALRIIRKIFPFRDKCKVGAGKPCFHCQIGLCPGVCTGEISKKNYAKVIRNLKFFFEGKKRTLLKSLYKEMKESADALEFEKANKLKKTIFALEHIQDVALLKHESSFSETTEGLRIEAYDIAHISGAFQTGAMVVVEDGEPKKSDYRKFKIKTTKGADDTAALKEVLDRRFKHREWSMPDIIVIDGGKAQKNTAEKLLDACGLRIDIVSVVKDNRHKPREILGKRTIVKKYERDILLANNEAHRFAIGYHRKIRSKIY